MDDNGPTASIILFVILLIIDMIFYGFGAAIQQLNSKDIDKKAEEEKNVKAKRLSKIIHNPFSYVNTVQVVVTMINLIMGGFYLRTWQGVFQNMVKYQMQNDINSALHTGLEFIGNISFLLTTFLLMLVIITFGVLLPKRFALKYPEKWANALITPIYFTDKILHPLNWLIKAVTSLILRLFGINPHENASDVTEEEIIFMVNEGHEQGVLQKSEAEMITNIFELGDKEAKDIMSHRKNIVAIDKETSLAESIRIMLLERNSRYPVYEENIDHIIGIIHSKDAMRVKELEGICDQPISQIEGLIRQANFIPETRNIDALFKEMQSEKIHMVIVVDEYGQTTGIVAMEDILEEIVGNILDEYDEDEKHIEETGENIYVMEGLTTLEELEDKLLISFDKEEYETLNGFLISKLEKIPEDNEEFDVDYEGYNFKVLSVENKMIASVLVTKLEEETLEPSDIVEVQAK